MKEDNLRLHNENERLQSIIVNYINEGKLHEISELEDIFKKRTLYKIENLQNLEKLTRKNFKKF